MTPHSPGVNTNIEKVVSISTNFLHNLSSLILLSLVLLGAFIPSCHCLTASPAPPSPAFKSLQSKGLLVQPHDNLYILGTVHLGSASANDAQLLFETVQPSKVIVELPPSRLKRMAITSNDDKVKQSDDGSGSNLMQALSAFPALASAGWSVAGTSGMMVTIAIIWSSLVKRSLSSSEEAKLLPRVNEFEAAVIASYAVAATVIPADLEFEELIRRISSSMSMTAWRNLVMNVVKETLGVQDPDPVRRRTGESLIAWEDRRRQMKTARASREHSERTTPELHHVLVTDRDEEFARLCLEAIQEEQERESDKPIVCVLGAVHVDGVVAICRKQLELQKANGD